MRVKQRREFLGRFFHGEDLLGSLEGICKKEEIRLGVFTVIGALKNAKLGYYKQKEKQYVTCVDKEKTLEITCCTGNISLLDGKIFVHAHITLADHQGQCYGGHLMPGARIFAAEYYIKELTGVALQRELDKETGLNLWPI